MEGTISLFGAFGAGILSFLSPCVLPILPTYTAFLAGTDSQAPNKWRFLINSFFFLSGFTLVFVAMGATASFFCQVFFDYQEVIRKFGAVFMILMGIQIIGLFPGSFLHREYRPLLKNTFQGPLGAFVLGVAFTAGWTPCTGPILASILVYAGTSSTMGEGAFLLFIYAMGFTVPFFVIAFFMHHYLDRLGSFFRYLPVIQRGAAIVLIVAGIFIYFDLLQRGLGLFWSLLPF